MPQHFEAVEIIAAKRDARELSTEEIQYAIAAYTRGDIGDEQFAALNMAIYLNGMTRREVSDWTDAMIASGRRLNYQALPKVTVDKHSTGGVGDKLSLILGPMVASFGVAVPMLSGRGLGHTGGTLDKLESIPGYTVDLDGEAMMRILNDVGVVIAAAGADLAPADKRIYALRDITATVDCVPLIASSIMSKKIAAGADNLLLDVKVGSGAFMKNIDQARELVRAMVDLGNDAGVRTRALITDMNTPLGLKIGNALEVEETLEVLAGGGPADVVELTCRIAREMLDMAGLPDADVEAALRDGRAMDSWRAMVSAQGGDPDAALPKATETYDVVADADGFVAELDALSLGVASWRLGAGRSKKGEPVQAGAGIEIHAPLGTQVRKGQKILTLHTDTPERFDRALESALPGISVAATTPERVLVHDRIV